MKLEIAPYGGWERCAHLSTKDLLLVVPLEVGPRILHFGLHGEPNLLARVTDEQGLTGGRAWRLYGGHRLWVAPEDPVLTYQPDNEPVEHEWADSTLTLRQPVEAVTGLRKELALEPLDEGKGVGLLHRITNQSDQPRTLALWALTCMAPGGRCVIPNETYRPHTEDLLPARPLVLWSYTDLSDPRFCFHRGFLEMRQDPSAVAPQKIGMLNRREWAAYLLGQQVFIKRFPYLEGADYPDFGCNCEFFTNAQILEMESLGPLVTLEPGDVVEHREHWELRHVSLPLDDDELVLLPETLGLASR